MVGCLDRIPGDAHFCLSSSYIIQLCLVQHKSDTRAPQEADTAHEHPTSVPTLARGFKTQLVKLTFLQLKLTFLKGTS
jgi:hypothetical protein